jgi:hypothetical protein
LFSAEAPEVIVRVQPNSFTNDSKKTPKVLNVPQIMTIMMKAAATTT